MKEYRGKILYAFVTWTLFLNFNIYSIFFVTYGNIDKKIIPLLIPPYNFIKKSLNHSEIQNFNITFIKNMQ